MNKVESHNSGRRVRHPLRRSLLIWFLLLSLLPLTLTAWLGYRAALNDLLIVVTQELEQDARANVHFIRTWFDYRLMDISSQAENKKNAKFLISLKEGLQASGGDLSGYVKSYDWVRLVESQQEDLITFSRRYDYIDDLYLIGNDGNILFSVKRELDLGLNLFYGDYADSRFSHAAQVTVNTGRTLFSDLERYAPSPDRVTGFITAPILDGDGVRIGLFAIKIRAERINALMRNVNENSQQHYMVGGDGFARTPLKGEGKESVMFQRIDTDQFKLWQHEHQMDDGHRHKQSEIAFEYIGPNGMLVIGVHEFLELPGVEWVLISEIDRDEALAGGRRLGKITLIMFLLTAVLVAGMAIFLAQRITRPIIQLATATRLAAKGEWDQSVDVNIDNEIGVLADAFNAMLMARQRHEKDLEVINNNTVKALSELANQKFALDQHAIVAITDVEGTITFVNDKFTEISGYERDELIGSNHRLLNSGHHDIEFFRQLYGVISQGRVWHGEICNRAKDGQFYWVDTTIVPFKGDDGRPKNYIAIRTDITERKQSEVELLEAKVTAEAATQQKSDFLANMSHEIRTPMNGVIGMTGLLLDTELTVKQRSYADATMNSADALLTIINDILDFSKIEAGKMELESVSFDLQSLVEDVADLMTLKCQEKGVEMLLHFKPNTERFVQGDPGRVRQILLNLLSNAVKFTEQGYVLLVVESCNDGSDLFRVSVKDTGIGIAADKLGHIFSKFDQEDSSTTRKYGGTGLGLSICRQLCSLMGGEIKVESEKGKGSVFMFTMKLKAGDEIEGGLSLSENDYSQLQGLKVLIVDDTDIACTILMEQLTALNMRPSSVSSGARALEVLQQAVVDGDQFDMVISDYRMPGMDGEELARRIARSDLMSKGVMLMVSSSPRKGDGRRLKEIGFDGCLNKPLHPEEVPEILSLAWSAKQQGREVPLVTRYVLQKSRSGSHDDITFPGTRILLAEDNPINVMVATELLEQYGCIVTPAGNGYEALVLVKERKFDLVFMDCQMPEMDGFEATKEIRKFQDENGIGRTPIVAFTANAMAADKEKCLDAGMDDYITKPVNRDSLLRVMQQWLSVHMRKIERREIDERMEGAGEIIKSQADDESILDKTAFNDLKRLFGERFPGVIRESTKNAHDNVTKLELAAEQGDLDTLEQLAHALKGTSAQFGALRLNAVSLEMEGLAKEGKLENVRGLLLELKAAQEQAAVHMLRQSGEA